MTNFHYFSHLNDHSTLDFLGEPFRWDEVRRAQLRAELDAYYARLYSLTRDELRYTLRFAPKEIYGEDPSILLRAGFPGETFRVLKEKEVKQFGDASQSDETSSAGGVGQFECRMQKAE